ncbi:ATP-binding protein [Methylobacterium sp. Leaf456]|uniref:sensor histidine kinase n=1 Tax=Methylobacterium sp. Leaf456 TaxID=1736382 RepID=UPI00336AD513
MTVSDPQGQAVLRRALARWRDDAATAHLAREGAALLVLDGTADRLLHAAGAAAAYGGGVAGPDGRVMPALRLSEQVRRAGPVGERPRMVRLRLDPRGVAPPVVVLLARAGLDEEREALLLAPLGPLPTLRPSEVFSEPVEDAPEADARDAAQDDVAAPAAETAQEPAEAEETIVPEPPARFVWRSDGEGVLTHVSATHPDLAAVIAGRAWADLAADGIVEGAALDALLREKPETFRALPLVVRGRAFEHAIDVSGAPMGRPRHEGAGLSGFALLKERHPRPEEDEIAPADADPPEADSLSVNEHAAFREVARLLGLRFAPDDAGEEVAGAERVEGASGASVTPFPTPPARTAEAEARTRAALAELLERLPVGVLVYRADEVLFASQNFLALTGHPDQASLRAAGLAQLFRGLAPDARGGSAPVPFGKADGGTVALALDHARLDWDGAPADLCLVRAAEPQAAPPAAPPNDARLRAEQVLDSLEEGVVTLDADGRVVGLNPSAAELVHAHPKEVVGGRFADLFAPESLPALEAAVTDSQRSGASELLGVTARSGAAALRLRIARLFGEDAPGYCASLREIREDAPPPALPPATIPPLPPTPVEDGEAAGAWKARALARVGREIRPPLTAILSLTDMMLSDRFDRADAERLEAYLREVRLSGGRIAAILDDLRDLAALQEGGTLTFTKVGLNDLVSGCIGTMQAQAARDRIVVRTSLGPDLPPFLADERSIRQAALSVIGNAIRVTEAGGQVIVSTTLADRGEVALRVRDTGPGLSPEAVASALEPFRDGADPAGEAEGAGFGLTLTKALVEANRGRFRIGSRKDEGTLVEMIFPAA